jgi:hypothetical protein
MTAAGISNFGIRISNFEFIPRPPGAIGGLGGKSEIRNSQFEISPFGR